MPVHFLISSHDAKPVTSRYGAVKSDDELLLSTWGQKEENYENPPDELLQSSFKLDQDFSGVTARSNGFVDTVVEAYGKHHHLIIRPDDRKRPCRRTPLPFVAHEGKKQLIVRAVGTRYTVDFGNLAKQFTGLLHQNVVDKELRDWILPDFTTTTSNDTVVSAVIMMATLKAYFDYLIEITCGLPSITLEGTKDDWVKIQKRIDKLETFGNQPKIWAGLLRPIINRFIRAFDGERDMDFWNRICHHQSAGCGSSQLSGWLTVFCVWSCEGEWLPYSAGNNQVILDYPVIEFEKIPVGFCEVDVKVDDNGELFDCMMVSGHMASLTLGGNKDTLRPQPAWFMFIKGGGMSKDASIDLETSRKRREEANPYVSESASGSGGNLALKAKAWKKRFNLVWASVNIRNK